MSREGLRECRLCGAQIRMARTVKSGGTRFMPLDPQPSSLGTVALDGREWAYVYEREDSLTLFPDTDPTPDLYRTHFETCPPYREGAKALRRPRRDTGEGLE